MQPQSDLTLASRSSGTDGRHVASRPGRRGSSTPFGLAAALTDLSTAVTRILALQQLDCGDDELKSRLRRNAAELESLIRHLLHAGGSGPSLAPGSRASMRTARQRAAEQMFLVWLAEPTSADEVPLDGTDEPAPLARVLGELSLSSRVLAAETAAGLGLPAGATVGHAAAELLIAVKDPAGPQCRSFRAAVYYLRDLDRGRFVEPDDAKVAQ